MAQDPSDAIRRIEAEIRTLSGVYKDEVGKEGAVGARMLRASGDLDYETCRYEKRALETALHALRKQRESGADAAFSQNSASSVRIKGK